MLAITTAHHRNGINGFVQLVLFDNATLTSRKDKFFNALFAERIRINQPHIIHPFINSLKALWHSGHSNGIFRSCSLHPSGTM
jgi:hypothetical protein